MGNILFLFFAFIQKGKRVLRKRILWISPQSTTLCLCRRVSADVAMFQVNRNKILWTMSDCYRDETLSSYGSVSASFLDWFYLLVKIGKLPTKKTKSYNIVQLETAWWKLVVARFTRTWPWVTILSSDLNSWFSVFSQRALWSSFSRKFFVFLSQNREDAFWISGTSKDSNQIPRDSDPLNLKAPLQGQHRPQTTHTLTDSSSCPQAFQALLLRRNGSDKRGNDQSLVFILEDLWDESLRCRFPTEGIL